MNQKPLRVVALLLAGTTTLMAGCGGGGGSSPPAPQPQQNSAVTVLAASRGNDRLSQFIVSLNSLTLVSQSGKFVDVITKPQAVEFMHLNGGVQPLLTVTVPQDTYISASIQTGYSQFDCVTLDASGGVEGSAFANDSPNASVSMPSPVTINTPQASIMLELQVSQSAQYQTCDVVDLPPGTIQSFSVTPTFNLTAADVASQPTNSANGQASNLAGLVASVGATAGQFNVTTDYGLSWSVGVDGATVFQGVASFSALAAGMPVDMDVAIRADGSLVAKRVEVVDTDITSLSTFLGPLNVVVAAPRVINVGPVEVEGQFLTKVGNLLGAIGFDFSPAVFRISGQLGNLRSLPFTPSFNATNMVAGQNVYITNHLLYFTGPNYDPADTITLMPQTIDGTVTAVSSSGGFTTYTVALAPYDLFPTLAVQAGQTTLLQNPGTVVVYADSTTQRLNAAPAIAGSVLRFNGLVFNDNGTLRMDCAEVLDGVAL
jgi:Domain of unknown function (DUF5666)